MSKQQFIEVVQQRDMELAEILAALHGVSRTQIELWKLTIN